MNSSKYIGVVNIRCAIQIFEHEDMPHSYETKTIAHLLPPENCIVTDHGTKKLARKAARREYFESRINQVFNDSTLGSLTQKGKDVRQRIIDAEQELQATQKDIPICKISCSGEKCFIPLPYKFVVKIFQLARSGYNIDVNLNADGKVSLNKTRIQSAAKKQTRTIKL